MSVASPRSTEAGRSVFSLLFGLCSVGGAPLLVDGSGGSPLGWLVCGATAATALRWGWTQVAWVSAGATLAYVLLGHLAHPLGIVLGVVGAWAGALTLRAVLDALGFRRDFSRDSDVLRFCVGVMVAMMVPAAVMALSLLPRGLPFTPEVKALMFLRWTLNAAIGALLLIPPFLTFERSALQAWRREPRVPLLLAALAAVVVAAAVLRPSGYFGVVLLSLPLVAASAILVDITFTGLLVVACSLGAIIGVGNAMDVDSAVVAALRSGRLWAYCALLSGLKLGLHALRVERAAAEERLRLGRAAARLGVLSAVIREQERIGRDVRQTLGVDLETLSRAIEALDAAARERAPQLAEDLEAMRDACRRARESSDALASGLRPAIEHDADLRQALRELVERVPDAAGLEVQLEFSPGTALPPESSRAVYRIAQEALNNVLKHAGARQLRLALAPVGSDAVELLVEDDGIGLSDAARTNAGDGIGLRTMQHRAEVAGGELWVERRAPRGTRIRCRVPIRRRGGAGGAATPIEAAATGDASEANKASTASTASEATIRARA